MHIYTIFAYLRDTEVNYMHTVAIITNIKKDVEVLEKAIIEDYTMGG